RCAPRAYSTIEMLSGQKIVVVMPAYNAARTLQRTYDEVMEQGIVDLVIVVDDASNDETVAIARTLKNVQVEVHAENRGYGGNQKTSYRLSRVRAKITRALADRKKFGRFRVRQPDARPDHLA